MPGKTAKSINRAIRAKMDAWLNTITDDDLRMRVRKELIVTGGCIPSFLLGEIPNDYDVYVKTHKTALDLATYYTTSFMLNNDSVQMDVMDEIDTLGRPRVRVQVKSDGIAIADDQNIEDQEDLDEFQYIEPEDKPSKEFGDPVFISNNAISLKGGIQVIIRFTGDAEAIHKNFDFIHCFSWWSYKSGVVLNSESLEAILSKTLVYRGSLYPICSVFRSKKFIERGWKINAGQYLKMALQIHKLDLTNRHVLEEQLTGVDAAYFSRVISIAMKDKPDDVEIEHDYLVTVLERLFG